jgi:alpha-mannosidase
MGITFSSIEAHLVEFGGLWPGYVSQAHHGVTPPYFEHEFLKPGELTKGYIYSYLLNSNFRTNFQPTQQGDMLFRYSITTHKGDWREGRARNFGWAISNPLIPVQIHGKRKGTMKKSVSFCQVDKPNVLLSASKRAEDGDGIILRLTETGGEYTTVTLTFPFLIIHEAHQTNLVEENEKILPAQKGSVTVPIKAFGVRTIRIKTVR